MIKKGKKRPLIVRGNMSNQRAVEREERKDMQRTIAQLQREIGQYRGNSKQMLGLSEMLSNRAHMGIDVGYIKTLLFPELYNADIPQPMSTQSYCRFTDKKEISLASKGNGMLIWYPKVTIGPQLFIRFDSNLTVPVPLSTNYVSNITTPYYKKGGSVNFATYFSQTNLVSASISIQYIGQLQHEQGFMVGSQVYGVPSGRMTQEDAENGQFRVMTKPGDGLRMVYLPKDLADFQYYSCMTGANTAGQYTKSGNQGARPTAQYDTWSPSTEASAYIGDVVPVLPKLPGTETNAVIDYSQDADCIVIYWKGLYTGDASLSSDFRVDIMRKFNGFPLSEHRDVLDLIKPKKLFDPKKTIDVVTELQSAVPQLAGHSLKQMDRISDQIQEYLPNVGHLYNEGQLKEGSSMEGFAQQLQESVGTEGGSSFTPGRIYE